MTDNHPVTSRVHPRINEWLEAEAERRMTSKARVVEDVLKNEMVKDKTGERYAEGYENPDLRASEFFEDENVEEQLKDAGEDSDASGGA